VSPGDSITVSITLQGSINWQISIVDTTTGQSYQTMLQYNSSLSSAEWIEEAPAAGRSGFRMVTLDDFGQVQFQSGTAIVDGTQETIAQAHGQPTVMYSRSTGPLAQPSALGADGESFTVTYVGSSGSAVSSGAPPTSRRSR
jgi:hypothetical protein